MTESGGGNEEVHVANGHSNLAKSGHLSAKNNTDFLIDTENGYIGEEVFEYGLVASGVVGAEHTLVEFRH